MSGSVRVGEGTLTLPGFVNSHSHAFHRALRGVSETDSGDFWTWRKAMYQVAERLEPDSYRELATFVYAEMVLSGWTAVGEFHYLHHGPGGVPYADPNEMSYALLEAAHEAGIRLTLLDTCYLQASVSGDPLEGVQRRFGDGGGEAWMRRVTAAADSGRFTGPARLGAAIHSVRAVPRPAMTSVVAWAAEEGAPLHVHVSEQRRENEEALVAFSMTPTDLLHEAGALSRRTTAVHATHLSPLDISRYGLAGAAVCACPTTEADLGDGVGAFADLAEAGAALCIGSDSHAIVDPFQETRALETNQRLVLGRRGVMTVASLLAAATAGGARSLGLPPSDDSVVITLDSPHLAGGGDEESIVARVLFAGVSDDVTEVTVDGRTVVSGGEHDRFGSRRAVADRLSAAIRRLLG